ncbi:MAG: glycerol-3-phosphate 1-O-acyltransferase PlsY [Holosporales bacterium]|jgi:glycerol-3-phosphate acyltransferase PlsY|nr:glycerol-3-phosphate 1-O-acyltransferase PlsY [Holosporales bacterium]
MNLPIMCLIGYLVGSIPTGFLLTKLFSGIDLRNFGSNSTGATNVLRTGDKKLALLTMLMDVLKGAILTLSFKLFSHDPYYLFSSFFCIIGHAYSIWLLFKGGKGVATSAGIFLVISPAFAIISITIWAILAKFVKVSSIASISLSFSFVIMCSYGFMFHQNTSFDIFLFSIVCLGFLLLTHSKNIKRIIRGSEHETSVNG